MGGKNILKSAPNSSLFNSTVNARAQDIIMLNINANRWDFLGIFFI